MRKAALALVAFAAFAPAVSASAAPPNPSEHALECFRQWVTVAEPVMRPVQVGPDGSVHIYPSEVTNKVDRDVARAVQFASCLASG